MKRDHDYFSYKSMEKNLYKRRLSHHVGVKKEDTNPIY